MGKILVDLETYKTKWHRETGNTGMNTLGRGYAGLLLFREEWRLTPHGALEMGESRGRTGKSSVTAPGSVVS